MSNTEMFALIMGAVMSANLLTAAFIWGMVKYTRLEAEGKEKGADGRDPLIAICLACAGLVLSVFIVLG